MSDFCGSFSLCFFVVLTFLLNLQVNGAQVAFSGVKPVKLRPLLIGEETTAPWNAAMFHYGKKAYICSGSLISRTAILTAAHCILEDTDYEIVVGASSGHYEEAIASPTAQIIQVKHEKIYMHTNYSHYPDHHNDIALMVLEEAVNITEAVQLIKLPTEFQTRLVDTTSMTFRLAGLGTTAADKVSHTLNGLDVLTFDCNRLESIVPVLEGTCICGGPVNYKHAICTGDSGGGLTFEEPAESKRFFIQGIVSVGTHEMKNVSGCNRNAIFTKVWTYIDTFIKIQLPNIIEEQLLAGPPQVPAKTPTTTPQPPAQTQSTIPPSESVETVEVLPEYSIPGPVPIPNPPPYVIVNQPTTVYVVNQQPQNTAAAQPPPPSPVTSRQPSQQTIKNLNTETKSPPLRPSTYKQNSAQSIINQQQQPTVYAVNKGSEIHSGQSSKNGNIYTSDKPPNRPPNKQHLNPGTNPKVASVNHSQNPNQIPNRPQNYHAVENPKLNEGSPSKVSKQPPVRPAGYHYKQPAGNTGIPGRIRIPY